MSTGMRGEDDDGGGDAFLRRLFFLRNFSHKGTKEGFVRLLLIFRLLMRHVRLCMRNEVVCFRLVVIFWRYIVF